ncbi:MAG: hypothetical protein A2Y09_01660 [Planctomycetes bacterium GWA2_39_15]|nr:MAG: hypothetical protein A2Y09_01660 [Planctomycetes bacterium GWA2_39_15]
MLENMNKFLLKCLCFPLLFLFGCVSVDQRENRTEGVDSRRMEKRIDDLSSTITLIVKDTNRLHNKMEEVKTSNKTIQQKVEGLEATIRNLNEQIASLHTSAKAPEIAQPPAEKTDVEPQLPLTDSSKPSDKPASDIQKPVTADSQMAVAKGFWDAMNAKDIQAARSFVTKESADKLHIKEEDTTAGCKVTFGDIKIDDNKTTIDTTMQTNDGTTEFQVQMQTILIKEEGQWKVDAEQTMMSMFGGAMGEMMKGLGKALEEGFKKGFEEMGKSMAGDTQKGLEVMTQTSATSEAKPDITPQSEPEITIADQTKKIGSEESKQCSEMKPEIVSPPKQETTSISEEARRESFLKDNIVRLAEAAFPDNKGIQWNILSFEHKAHLTYVEAEPTSANLGYPRFKFVVSFKNPEIPRVIGTYCFKDGQYSLFSAKKK